MIFEPLLDAGTALAIEAAWLRHALAPVSSYGERAYARVQPFAPGSEARAQEHAERIARIAAALDEPALDAARDVARHVPDVSAALARASMGDEPDDVSLLELQRFFDACERFDALTASSPDVPRLASAAVRSCAAALERGRSGRFGFYLDDGFDTNLAECRRALERAQAELDALRGRELASLAAQLGREIAGNEFIVMRGDVTGALPAGVRVVREAPTYWLCEIEAGEAVRLAIEKREAAAAEVARAESRVRDALGAIVRAHAAALDAACTAFAQADLLIACARFTRTYGCTVPQLDADAPFVLEGARYVPLAQQLERDGRAFTPIDVMLDGVAVLTGPNMGGKSVALRSCAFIALCAALGLPVPAKRARLPLVAQIAWLGIGGDERQDGVLSAFAREVVRLNEVLAAPARPRLILMDEFARTTTPREGKALVVAVVRRLQDEGAIGLVATHVDGVARAAGVRHYAVRGLARMPERPPGDLHDALATLAASMDYTLVEVRGESRAGSDAIALAGLLGMDPSIVDAARAALEHE
jgi:DNA mismatch repair protein MutS2